MSGSKFGSSLPFQCEASFVNESEEVGNEASPSFTGPQGFCNAPKPVNSSQAAHSNFARPTVHMDRLRRNQIVAADDLQAQQRLHWLSKFKNTLRTDEEKQENKWKFCILKLPGCIRQPSEEYTPAAWRFGLHNRENLDTNGSEALKISMANAFGLAGDKWDDFCNVVVDDPKSMLQCYGLQEEGAGWSDDVIKYVLALDALFLAINFDLVLMSEAQLWTTERKASLYEDIVFQSRIHKWAQLLGHDIFKYENQIPFELIRRTYKYLRKSTLQSVYTDHVPSDENIEEDYRCWEKKWMGPVLKAHTACFMDLDFSAVHYEYPYPSTNIRHFLQIAYEAICGMEGIERECEFSHNQYIHIPSASQLKASGIKIKGTSGPLCKISFESNCLTLPTMWIWDTTIPFIRNMAKYEEQINKCMFHDYVFIMIDLIKTTIDLEILTKYGAIKNENANRAYNNWIAVGQNQLMMPSSKEHNEMKVAINKRCELKRYRFWREFRLKFCSRPWLVLSAITIFLVTVATLIQTYAAIIGSNRMKPQFP